MYYRINVCLYPIQIWQTCQYARYKLYSAYIIYTMSKTKPELLIEIENVLDTLRDGLAMHAGNVELVDMDIQTGIVSVRFQGTCVGCPMSGMTLKAGIEDTLRELVPEVTEVVAV